jgi:hypothetical protein
MKKTLISILAITALSVGANASCGSTGCYNIDIAKLYVASNGNIYIGTSGDESKLGCTSPGNTLVTIPNAHPGKNAIYSLLLTAKTTKQKLTIRTVDGSANCEVAYAFQL